MKICSTCKIQKQFSDFYRNKAKADGYTYNCKVCHKAKIDAYRATTEGREAYRESLRLTKEKWRALPENKIIDRERVKKYQSTPEGKEVRLKSKEKKLGRKIVPRKRYPIPQGSTPKREYDKRRRNNDELYHLIDNVRKLIRGSFNRQGYKKNSKTAEILGCSYDEFKTYLESRFVDGMGWENLGEWHFDHIIPVSLAKCEEEVLALNHYTNLRPLWGKENIVKSNKLPTLTEIEGYGLAGLLTLIRGKK